MLSEYHIRGKYSQNKTSEQKHLFIHQSDISKLDGKEYHLKHKHRNM